MIFELAIDALTLVLAIYMFHTYGAYWTVNQWLLPVYVLIPFNMAVSVTPGIPPLTLYMLTCVPVFLGVIVLYTVPFRANLADLLVVFLVVIAGISGVVSTDLKYGLFDLIDNFTDKLAPYFLVRILVYRNGVSRFLYLLAVWITVTALFAPLEFFFDLRLTQLYQLVWPDHILWPPFVRGGNFRVYSTYGHPIHAGMMFSFAFCISFFLWRAKIVTNTRVIFSMMAINAVAIYMTVSRASYVLTVPIILLMNMAFSKKRLRYFIVFAIATVAVVVIVLPIYNSYISSSGSMDETQTSAVYRSVLFNNYLGEILMKPWFGWGFYIPVVSFQNSIDNYYLWSALNYGIPYVVVFTFLFVVVAFGGVKLFLTSPSRRTQVVIWGLVCLEVYITLMCTVVWLTTQARVLLWITLGLAVSMYGERKAVPTRAEAWQPIV